MNGKYSYQDKFKPYEVVIKGRAPVKNNTEDAPAGFSRIQKRKWKIWYHVNDEFNPTTVIDIYVRAGRRNEWILYSPSQTPQSNDWKILGNTSTDPLINFLGTTDLIPLIFRTNNIKRGAISKNGGFVSTIDSTSLDQFLGNTLFDNRTGFTTVNQLHTILNFSDTGAAYGWTGTAVGGTPASPTLPVSGANLGATNGSIYDGAGNFRTVCRMRYQAVGQPTASSMPTKITFHTTGTGAIATTERMVINESGNIGIGTTSPTSTAHINGSFAKTSTVIAANYTALATDSKIICNNVGAAITITLPDPTTCIGREISISRAPLSIGVITITNIGTPSIQNNVGVLAGTYTLPKLATGKRQVKLTAVTIGATTSWLQCL